MSQHFQISTQNIPAGGSPAVQKPGEYLKLLRSTGKVPVLVKFDTGYTIRLNPGMGIPATFKYFNVSTSSGSPVTADFFISTIPLLEPHKVQDDGTMTTGDVLTLPSRGALPNAKLVLVPGTLVLLGQNWRRRKIVLTNTDVALDAFVQPSNAAFGSAGALRDGLKLPHGDATPVSIDTDDDLNLANHDAANTVDVRLFQIWYPDLTT